jgi:hypothetical protein
MVGTRLDEQHVAIRILAQSRCEHAAGRAAAHDDHVESH